MKAIVWTKYGPPDVLQLKDVEKPVPKDNEVLIRICATTVTAGDCEMRRLKFPLYLSLPMRFYLGFRRPKGNKTLGQEMSGKVEEVGKDVKSFKPGDRVFGSTGFGSGTNAEYICLPEKPAEMDGVIALKPENLTHDEAAGVPTGGLESLHFLRRGDVQRGQKVLINGAGGSIGTLGVQLAKHFGADVTAVDSTEKLDTLRSIGADKVIDYTQEDFTTGGETYDVIFDVVGKSPFKRSLRSLNKNGFFLIANPRLLKIVRGKWTSRISGKRVISAVSSHKTEDLIFLKELVEEGKIRPVIDRRYPLERTAEAHSYVETGAKKGNVVITVAEDIDS